MDGNSFSQALTSWHRSYGYLTCSHSSHLAQQRGQVVLIFLIAGLITCLILTLIVLAAVLILILIGALTALILTVVLIVLIRHAESSS